jgi:hypothetical protein
MAIRRYWGGGALPTCVNQPSASGWHLRRRPAATTSSKASARPVTSEHAPLLGELALGGLRMQPVPMVREQA